LEALLNLEGQELLYDLRETNPGRPCQLNTFGQKSKEFNNEWLW